MYTYTIRTLCTKLINKKRMEKYNLYKKNFLFIIIKHVTKLVQNFTLINVHYDIKKLNYFRSSLLENE